MNTNLQLKTLKELIKNKKADLLLLRSTDSYFNEYVPEYLSPRAFITKFNGSVGDALITTNNAHLFVDGRYELQAQEQARDFNILVTKNNLSIENSWLNFLSEILKPGQSLLYDPTTLDLGLSDKLASLCESLGVKLIPEAAALISQIFKPEKPASEKPHEIWPVSLEITGSKTSDKIQKIDPMLTSQGVQGFLVVKLDDIAWLLNMRGNAFPFQRTFPSLACLMSNKIILGLKEGWAVPEALKTPDLELVEESVLIQKLKSQSSKLNYRNRRKRDVKSA